ncbi:MAG: hypothetical protein U9Q03_01765 [Patescibacteria group bacterium]|nr:hypothetical protein [Patescibacteria group bacterium]
MLSTLTSMDLLEFRKRDFTRLLNERPVAHQVTEEVVTHFLKLVNAFWRHDGNLMRSHAELTSGRCSDGFVNVPKLLVHTPVCTLFARELVALLGIYDSGPVDWVVGSDHAGAVIAHQVAVELGAKFDFTVKADDGVQKRQIWRGHVIRPDERVLQVEELITTTATLQAVRRGVIESMGDSVRFNPCILTIVNRSGLTSYEGRPIVALAKYSINTWLQEECPLCEGGSPRVRPKDDWRLLNGKV